MTCRPSRARAARNQDRSLFLKRGSDVRDGVLLVEPWTPEPFRFLLPDGIGRFQCFGVDHGHGHQL